MGIEVRWYNETQDILLVVYEERWTIQDYYESVELSAELIDAVSHRVDIIQDGTHMREFPTKLLAAGRYTENRAHPRRGDMIMIGMPVFVKRIIDIGRVIAPKAAKNIYFVDSMDEALRKLSELRNTR